MAETVKELTEKLVRCRSVTPSDAGAQDILENFLKNSLKAPVTEHLDWENTRNLFIHEDRPGKVSASWGTPTWCRPVTLSSGSMSRSM